MGHTIAVMLVALAAAVAGVMGLVGAVAVLVGLWLHRWLEGLEG